MINLYGLLESLEDIENDKTRNQKRLNLVDSNILNIYHELELFEHDAVGLVRLAKELKLNLRQRREYKNKQRFYDSILGCKIPAALDRVTNKMDQDMLKYVKVTEEKLSVRTIHNQTAAG